IRGRIARVGRKLLLTIPNSIVVAIYVVDQRAYRTLAPVDESVAVQVVIRTQDVERQVFGLLGSKYPRINERVLSGTVVRRTLDLRASPRVRGQYAVGRRPYGIRWDERAVECVARQCLVVPIQSRLRRIAVWWNAIDRYARV